MFARLFASSRSTAAWFINQNVEPQLHTMSIAVGTGGQLIYMPPGGLSQSAYGSLLGRPVIPIEQCASIGTVGDIILADYNNGYILAEKGGIKSDMSIHVRFIYDEQVFRFVLRIDGQPWLASKVTPFKGGSDYTQSHFVALQTRS
jgi:HK97 family phage major capsid protein